MVRFWTIVAIGVAAALAGVAWYVAPAKKPRGYAGLEFAAMTPAAEARAPLLTTRGALVFDVAADGPAAQAGIHAGEVVAAIDGYPVTSADQAAGLVRSHSKGDRLVLTLFDETKGDIHPRQVTVMVADVPPVSRTLSVVPPRALAKEYFYPPAMAANASWSRRIARGATIRPIALTGLGDGHCNGFAPEGWRVAGHAPDDSLFHVMAGEGFLHAIYQAAPLNGRAPQDFVRVYLEKTFGSPVTMTPAETRPFGFTLADFGNRRGGAGFVVWQVVADRITMRIAAVAGADAGWAKQLAGAVVLSLRCPSGAPARPRDPRLIPTTVSTRCLESPCEEGDFAASYMTRLRLGYVHNAAGEMFLVNPRRDLWLNGAEGPGFYHQIGGTNEKLEPGRID